MTTALHRLETPAEAAAWLHGRVTAGLRADSRQVRPGDGFIAWPGAASDGRDHVEAALVQGAAAVLVEGEGVARFAFARQTAAVPAIATYAGLKAATGPIAAAFYGEPSRRIDLLAVTGTNGKTSSAWWLAQALSKVELPKQIPCAFVGTLGIGFPPEVAFNGLTTPDPVLLHGELARLEGDGAAACAIEASSVGIAERRLDGARIRVAVFTNFTQDHLDYHGSMEAYWQAKAALFAWPGLRAAVVNIDDPRGTALAGQLGGGPLDLWTVSMQQEARLRAEAVAHAPAGLAFTLVEGNARAALCTALLGRYNVSNLLGVVAAMRALGVPLAECARACTDLLPVPGRLERFGGVGAPLVAVDYAHTPDALDKVLGALRPVAQARGGRLWCVFGCGGERDPVKRPLMAAAAEKGADRVVVTSDNPRGERPEAIISQILLGLSHDECVRVEADRARAIAGAVAEADPADVVLLAGKGHEDYQEVAGVKHPFDDRQHARAALARRGVAA